MEFRMSFRKLPLALAIPAALATCFSPHAQAQSEDRAESLDAVVVTATRTAITADESLAPVEVLDAETIRRSQARSLVDLLRGRAGVNLTNQGGAGKLTTVSLRGAETDQVLVLIDGVRVGSATSGLTALQDLPVEMIERIEIVRGPRSSLYGSEALGGVIQIFTRRDRGPATFRFNLGAGSHGHREGGLGVGGSGVVSESTSGWFGFDASLQRTDGIDACRGAGFPIFAGCFVDGQTDRDGYRRHSVSLRGGLDIGERVELTAQALRVSGENDYDGGFVDNSEIVQRVLGAHLRWRATEAIDLRFGVGSHLDRSDNFLGDAPTGVFQTRRDSATAQADIALADDHLLSVGADWLRDRVGGDTGYAIDRRGNRAAFAQYQGRFGAQDVQLALRRDDNDQFGGETTGNVAWGLSFAERWRITAGYGTAFKAPSFNELYFPGFGNPALRPESSRTLEAGIGWRGERVALRLDAFATRAEDLIAFNAATFSPDNIERARLHGAELRFDGEALGWTLGASASWLRTENRAPGPNRGKDLPRRAGETLRIELDRAFGDFSLGFTGLAEGERWDDLANRRRLDGFATLDVRAEYRFGRDWTVQGRVANLFDERYETAAFYRQPGREYFVSLRFLPQR
jgi:vitamin B12 transporter